MFKDPGLSVLQIGGHEHGVTDSLLLTLKAGSAGQALSAKIVILDHSEEAIIQIREKYDAESSIVDALHFDASKPLPSEATREDGFDVVLVTIDHGLDDTSKQDLLAEAQNVLKAGGTFVVYDTLRAMEDR
jgi:ubiquinone/menaquinone biosynthesis C-methylase UbiE